MPIADAAKRKIGREIIDWIYLGIRTGARRSVVEYHKYKATAPALAESHLARAVNMPLRARARINQKRTEYETQNGAGTFNAYIGSCLSLAGTVTLAELNAELTALENYANNLIAQKQSGALTLDQIAQSIETDFREEASDWRFPIPATYTDTWPASPAPSPPPTTTVPQSAGTLNAVALAYGRSPVYSAAELQEIAQKFGVVIGSASGLDAAAIKTANPNTVLLEYINTTNVTVGDSLWDFIQAEPTPNDLIRQAVTACVQDVDGTIYNLNPGDYVHSYRQSDRWQTDYSDAAKRSRLAAYVAAAGTPNWDGFFIDNDDRGGGYAGFLTSGTVEGGITGPQELSASATNEAYLNALKEAVDAAVPANKYLTHNVSNYGIGQFGGPDYWWTIAQNTLPDGTPLSRSYVRAFMLSRGVFQEFKYAFDQTYADIAGEYDGIREIWEARGSPANHLNVMWWLARGAGTIANNDPRVQLFAMGSHLLHQFGSAWIRYDGLDLNNVPLTGDWFGAMGANLGTPTENKTALDANTWRRRFTAGIVVVRFRTTTADNYTDAQTYQLGGTYTPINADGTSGTPVTQVTLQNSEAFIGVA